MDFALRNGEGNGGSLKISRDGDEG